MKGANHVFREYDALAYDHGDYDKERAVRHVDKKARRAKGQEVVFDPKGHREYLTGFRKRKQQRRQNYLSKVQSKEREERKQEREERRTKLKSQLGLDDRWGVEDSDDSGPEDEEELEKRGEVRVFEMGGLTTTVTTVQLEPDSGPEASDADDDDEGVEEGSEEQQGGNAPQSQGGKVEHGKASQLAKKTKGKHQGKSGQSNKLKVQGKKLKGDKKGKKGFKKK